MTFWFWCQIISIETFSFLAFIRFPGIKILRISLFKKLPSHVSVSASTQVVLLCLQKSSSICFVTYARRQKAFYLLFGMTDCSAALYCKEAVTCSCDQAIYVWFYCSLFAFDHIILSPRYIGLCWKVVVQFHTDSFYNTYSGDENKTKNIFRK